MQNFFDGVPVTSVLRYADAHCDRGQPLLADIERSRRNGVPQTLSDYVCALEWGLGQQDHELFPTHSGYAVVRPDRFETLLHEPLEDVIAHLMPKAIIDGLEVVQVERQHRERNAAALGPVNFGIDPLHETTPIVSTRQWIGRGKVAELPIGALELLQGTFSVRHRLGKTHHQLPLTVNLRERPSGEERLRDPIAQQEESSGEDRMGEPPHMVPGTP